MAAFVEKMWAAIYFKMNKSVFTAHFEILDEIREFVGEIARRNGFSDKEIYAIQCAADEASSNIIEHAYAEIENGKIEIECGFVDGELKIVMRDNGKPFDPSSIPEPNIKGDLFEREIGGLGVFLMRKLMDKISYESSLESGNKLTMLKIKGDSG